MLRMKMKMIPIMMKRNENNNNNNKKWIINQQYAQIVFIVKSLAVNVYNILKNKKWNVKILPIIIEDVKEQQVK